jgi:hypothetical protein
MSLYMEGHPPVFSETGVWDEKGFYPARLARELHGYGFDAHVRTYVGSARGPLWSAVETLVNRLPDSIRFLLRPAFLVHARKVRQPHYLVMPDSLHENGSLG